MGDISTEMADKLAINTVFEIPIFGGIPVSESVVTTWIIMAILIILAIVLTRNLKLRPTTKRQVFLEMAIGGLSGIITGAIGEKGKKFVPYIGTVGLFLVFANVSGALGVSPPTRNLNMTITLAVMSIVLVQAAAFKEKSIKGWAGNFIEPMPGLLPINILEVFIKPLSLCMRLFGNMLGGFIIMELLRVVVPIFIPVIASFYFEIFDGLIQAYIFVFLTSLYIHEAI